MGELLPDDFDPWVRLLPGLRHIIKLFSSRDVPVCNTRIVRAGRGLPWGKRVAVHPTGDGVINVKPLDGNG